MENLDDLKAQYRNERKKLKLQKKLLRQQRRSQRLEMKEELKDFIHQKIFSFTDRHFQNNHQKKYSTINTTPSMEKKSRVTAILLAFFLGALGAHRFYLGQIGRGILYFVFFFVSWFFAIIDVIMLAVMSDDDFDRKYNPHLYVKSNNSGEYVSFNANSQATTTSHQQQYTYKRDEYDQVLDEVRTTYKEISQMIDKSKDNGIVGDIKSMMGNYVSQVEILLEKDKKLKTVHQSISASTPEVNKQMADLKQKLALTTNPMLKDEYERSIEKYQKHLQSFQDLKDQREVLRLRINSALMSMKQVKIDLIKMENMASLDEREMFIKGFEEKSKDLSNYLNTLESSYKDIM